MNEDLNSYLARLNQKIDNSIIHGSSIVDNDLDYLSQCAPNIIEWVTGVNYWNVPSTFDHLGQYQQLRDIYNLRCKLCNSQKPEDISCWDKSRLYLESENLLIWDNEYKDFVCPKCGNTMTEFIDDGLIIPYNECILIVGMRAGKSYTIANIGGYIEHFIISQGIKGTGVLQTTFGQEKSEWFECTYAASTATQAETTVYAKYREMRKNSPWISKYMEWVRKKEKMQIGAKEPWKYKVKDNSIDDGWIKVRFNRIASDSSGIAGKTRLFGSIDEWARLVDTEGTRSQGELYRVINQSLKTVRTYTDYNNMKTWPVGFMGNVTSPIAQDDPAMTHKNKASKGELKRTYWLHCATWDYNPFQPREAFNDEYEKDPVGAERDYGANPPNAATPLVNDPLRFWKSIDFDRKPIATFKEEYRTDPTGELYVAASLENCEFIPGVNHYIFGDAGQSWDSFALVCGHPEWINSDRLTEDKIPEAKGRIEPTNSINKYGISENSPMALGLKPNIIEKTKPLVSSKHPDEMLITVIDFAMRIIPTVSREIWFQCVVDIIRNLKDRIKIATVCFDRWSSTNTIQQIRDMNIMSYQHTLKAENFVSFVRLACNNRVSMLPPHEDDKLDIDDKGNLILSKSQINMSGEGVCIVEIMKLNRSPDLKKVYNPNKGKKRGVDSDDIAHCASGVHYLIQESVIDRMADTKKKKEIRKRQVSQSGGFRGVTIPGKGNW